MKNKKRHVLILGASSDIGIEAVKNFLKLKWKITAHFSKNKKKLEILKKTSKNLNTIKFNFANYNNLNIEGCSTILKPKVMSESSICGTQPQNLS